jgi:hypothetical protein
VPSRDREPEETPGARIEPAAAAPQPSFPAAVLALQRSAGNAAVAGMIMRRQWDLGAGRSVGKSAGPTANTREDVLDVQDRLHALWDIPTGDYGAEHDLVGAQPPETVVATARFPKTLAGLDKAESDDALAPGVAQAILKTPATGGVGTGQPNKKEDVEAVQHGMHTSWDLSNEEFADAQKELGTEATVDENKMPVTKKGIRKMRKRVIEGYPGGGGPQAVRPAVVDPKSKAPARGKEDESSDLSDELSEAPMAPTGKERVQLWMKKYAGILELAEKRHGVDRRAIAGAIAWEALQNVQNSTWPGRWSGAGKVHNREFKVQEGNPASKVVGDEGYLPPRTEKERQKENEDPVGAITFVATIMQAHAEAADAGKYDIRGDPGMLCTFYNSWDIATTRGYFPKTKKAPDALTPNVMGSWVEAELGWIESATGKPNGDIAARAAKRGW